MITTNDVPMPEPVGSTTYFDLELGDVVRAAYTADQVRDTAIKYADARCAKLQEECDRKQKQIHRRANAMNAVYAELQRVAPWSESNDMDWADEMICGIGLLAQERDALAEKVKALQDDARRYRWLRDNKQRRRDGDYMNPAFCGVEFYHRAEGIIGPGPDLDAAIDAASGSEA